jgi:hypothetical protein
MKQKENSLLEQLIIWSETASKQSIIDKANELLKIEKENNPIEEKNQKIIELMQVLETVEHVLQNGDSINPDSFVIRTAVRLAIGMDVLNIGRGIGYDIIEHIPPQEVHDISATKIREQLKNK